MTCGHCVRAVTDAVRALDPAATIDVNLNTGRVTVQGGSVSTGQIVAAIAAEGYVAAPTAA